MIKKTAGPDPSKSWVSLRVTSAKDPERTYLTGCQEGSTQRRLVVEVPAKWSKDHKGIILRIKKDMEEKKTNKGRCYCFEIKVGQMIALCKAFAKKGTQAEWPPPLEKRGCEEAQQGSEGTLVKRECF